MRIEISAGGLNGSFSVAEYESNISSFINDTDKIISSFQAVSTSVASLNGGIGNLQNAFDNITDRIQIEDERKQDAIEVRQKSNDFIDLALRVDQEVAELVNQNKEEFYQVNPWLRPANDNVPWYEAVLKILFNTTKEIIKEIVAFELWKLNLYKKALQSICQFYLDHMEVITKIAQTLGLLISAAISLFNTIRIEWFMIGILMVFFPYLGIIMQIVSIVVVAIGVVAAITTVISTTMEIIDIWGEIDNPAFQSWKTTMGWVDLTSNLLFKLGMYYQMGKDLVNTISKFDAIGKTYKFINKGYDLLKNLRTWPNFDNLFEKFQNFILPPNDTFIVDITLDYVI